MFLALVLIYYWQLSKKMFVGLSGLVSFELEKMRLEIFLRALGSTEVGVPEEVHFFHAWNGLGTHDTEANFLSVCVVPH